jgi:hypothetical protein
MVAPVEEPAGHVVTFTTQWGSYNAGEAAAFSVLDADVLIELGVATAGEARADVPPDRPSNPPAGGVMVAGLEFPPRLPVPDPQHLDIPITYDPRVSTQFDRAARDRAAGKPGIAAQEDLERHRERVAARASERPTVNVDPPHVAPEDAPPVHEATDHRRRGR